MITTIETGYGTVELTTAMIEDDNGTDLHEGIDISLDGEHIGELIGYSATEFDEDSEEDVRALEDIVATLIY